MSYDPEEIREFNPADLLNLVRFCVQELNQRSVHALPLPGPFDGSGIYALYYAGDFSLYQHPSIRSEGFVQPIYVGRARLTKSSGLRPLHNRLAEHTDSIRAAGSTLRVDEFKCRFLVLHPVWVSTVETLLIEHFDTLWNNVIRGFGLHDPGNKRHGGIISEWDSLHPGRKHQEAMVEAGGSMRTQASLNDLVEAFKARKKSQNITRITEEEVIRNLEGKSSEDSPRF